MRRNGLRSLVVSVVITVTGLVYTFAAGNSPLLGLDLQGGVSVVLQPTGETDSDNLGQAIEIIRNRVDALGVAEPDITRQGETIVIQLPGIEDRDQAIELVGTTAELRFRPVLGDASGGPPPTGEQLPIDPGTGEDIPAGEEPPEDGPVEEPPADDTADEAPPAGSEDEPATGTDEEQGLGSLPPGESAAGLQAPETTAPADDPAEDGDTTSTTAPAEDGEDGDGDTTTTAPADPLEGQEECTVGEEVTDVDRDDPADEIVVLPEVADDNVIVRCYVLGPTLFTGSVLSGADAVIDQNTGQWTVNVNVRSGERDVANEGFNACFNGDPEICPATVPGQSSPSGAVGSVAIVLDSVVTTAPAVQASDLGNSDPFVISGEFTESEAKDLALVLRYGALPIELEQQAVQEVSATLGQEALDAGLVAGLVGAILVAAYMIAYYRLLGLIAILSLVLSGALLWTIIAYLGETQGLALTLAGITGIIVSVGVSVDTNVVFYEDLKEDTVRGRTMRSSVEGSFRTSFATIVKADLASLIGAVVLYLLTVGPVRGFALFLGIGTLLDLIVSYFFMRPAVLTLAKSRRFQDRPRLVGVSEARAPQPGAAQTRPTEAQPSGALA